MFCTEPVDIQDDYHWLALILQRAFKRDFQTSSGLTSSIFPLRFLSRFWYPQKTVSHTESKDIYIISEWLDMTKLWGQEGGLILTQIAAQRLHPPPQHFLQPSPPPFKKKQNSDVDRCGHLDITTHSKTMGIHVLPPLFWESFPQNVWSRLAGVRSHSAQRALVRLDGDVGLRSGCCAGLSCSSRPDWDKQFFARPLHGDAECHAERGNCCCKSWGKH